MDNKTASGLITEIYNKLDKPSPIGQYISFPPQKIRLEILPKGWDVNGGIWHAMNALLTWGYGKYDKEKARNSLIKNSMTKRAETYPNIWYGIWSGPDAYIADYAGNAGQAFYHLTTPMCDFPLMNLNLHACYLLSVIKALGIENTFESLTINENIFEKDFEFKSCLLDIDSKSNLFKIQYKGNNNKDFIIKIRKPAFWNVNTRIYLNKNLINLELENISIEGDYISLKLKEKYEQIEILITSQPI